MIKKVLFLGVALLAGVTVSSANALTIVSGDGNERYAIGPGYSGGDFPDPFIPATGNAVTILDHRAWYNSPNADWISFANTGATTQGGTTPANIVGNYPGGTRDITNYTALLSEAFRIGDGGGRFGGTVWADDTALFQLVNTDTNSIEFGFDPFQGQVDPCAPGNTGQPIGCVLSAGLTITNLALDPGNYELRMYTYQTNGSVFGAQWEAQAVPVPAALPMLGAAFAGLGFAARRLRKQQS